MSGGEQRLDPKVLQTILSDDAVTLLRDIKKATEAKVPSGTVWSPAGSGETIVKEATIYFPKPLFSISIINDGADEIDVSVNTSKIGSPFSHRVKVDETYTINMGAAKISFIYVKVDGGGSATIRYPGYY